MEPKIFRAKESDEFYTEERCHILEFANSQADPGLSIARVRVEPGVTTALHRIEGTAERYVILSGSGRIEVEGLEPEDVGKFDVVTIPQGANQRISNTAESDLIFLAICTPRFEQENYKHLE